MSAKKRGAAGISVLRTPSEEDLNVEGTPRDGTAHVCVNCTPTSTEHPDHIRHSSRVSSWCTHNIGGSCGVFVLVAMPLPENGSRVTPRHDFFLQTYLSPVVRKREFVISIGLL